MKATLAAILCLLTLLTGIPAAFAADPWPAEAHTNAVKLTSIDAGLDAINWSGAFWNPDTRTLWLSCNSGWFWALVEDGAGSFQVATNAAGTPFKWTPGGDLEGICQADFASDIVYLMDENGWIEEYDVSSPGTVIQNRNWDIRAQCPEAGGYTGGEGLAFIPNDYLRRQNFCDSNGVPRLGTNGMDGLMFVGYQADGFVYAFDLDPAGSTYSYVGRYKTGQAETADLTFDRATGRLYIWHNPGNVTTDLEVTELNSYADGPDRRLRQLAEYTGPRTGNLEGFAVVPSSATNEAGGCIVTDDNNTNQEAVVWYRQFKPDDDTDADDLADAVELWHFGSTTQTTGSADSDGDGLTNADEIRAGTDPTNAASVLIHLAPEADVDDLILCWQSVAGRSYVLHSTASITSGFTNTIASGLSATTTPTVTTVDVSTLTGLTFYQIATEPP